MEEEGGDHVLEILHHLPGVLRSCFTSAPYRKSLSNNSSILAIPSLASFLPSRTSDQMMMFRTKVMPSVCCIILVLMSSRPFLSTARLRLLRLRTTLPRAPSPRKTTFSS